MGWRGRECERPSTQVPERGKALSFQGKKFEAGSSERPKSHLNQLRCKMGLTSHSQGAPGPPQNAVMHRTHMRALDLSSMTAHARNQARIILAATFTTLTNLEPRQCRADLEVLCWSNPCARAV